jgi:hypothetical protein
VTRTGTTVRWWGRGDADPVTATAHVITRPGEVVLTVRGCTRRLRVGTDVVRARYDEAHGLAGRLAFLGPDGSPVTVLEVAEWLPGLIAVSDHNHGGLTEPVVWSGVQELTTAAGLPLDQGRVSAAVTDTPKRTAVARWLLLTTIALSLSGVVWIISLVAGRVDGARPVWSAALVVMLLCSLALFVEQQVRLAGTRRQPAGQAIAPRPSVPVTRRFVRDARLVLAPAGAGPLETLVVRFPDRMQEWFDGPASPLGIQRAVVVTPPGAAYPERVDLVDGLGRQAVQLPWDQWFGAGEQDLDALAVRGITIEQSTGPALAAPLRSLLGPRSTRYALDPYDMPGAFHSSAMSPMAAGASLVVILVGARLPSTLTVVIGVLNGVLLFGTPIARLLTKQWLDKPRAPR